MFLIILKSLLIDLVAEIPFLTRELPVFTLNAVVNDADCPQNIECV